MSGPGLRLRSLWSTSPTLVATGAAHGVLLLLFLGLILVDGRVVTGQPVWLKPGKFAASISLYALTLAWLLAHVEGRHRAVRTVGWVTAIALWLEILIIGTQAARGQTSHFNIATALDGALFTAMGVSILAAWIAGFSTLWLLWRQGFADRAYGLALRLGLFISLIGAGLGGLMTQPTEAQRAQLAQGHLPTRIGAHSVGAPDDGPGLPGVGWSTEGGDLRAPHFLGLHAMQVMPLLPLWLVRGERQARERARLALTATASFAYLGLIAVLTFQALRGEPLFAPGLQTLAALAGLGGATLVVGMGGHLWARRGGRRAPPGRSPGAAGAL